MEQTNLPEPYRQPFGQPARDTEVYKSDPVSGKHEDICWVGVGVKNAIAEDLIVDRPEEISPEHVEVVGLQVQSKQTIMILRSRCIDNL